MELKPIKTETEYRTALAEIERLFDVSEGAAEADRLEVLSRACTLSLAMII